MKIEEHEVGTMFARELKPQSTSHRRDQMDIRTLLEDALYELEVREIVLDIEDRVLMIRFHQRVVFGLGLGLARHFGKCVRARGRGELDPKRAA